MIKTFVALLVLLAAGSLQAQEVHFGELGYGGTGCPVGQEPSLTFNAQEGQLSFNQLVVSSGKKDGLINRKSCAVRLPISVAAGYQVGVRIRNVLGEVHQARGVRSNVQAQVSLVGTTSKPILENFNVKTSSHYLIAAPVDVATSWSGCEGQDAMLAINSAALSTRSKASATAEISVSDVNFDFMVRACN